MGYCYSGPWPPRQITHEKLPTPHLKMAPWGLGHLIKNNMVPDARAFYCPSADNAIQTNEEWYALQTYAQNIEDWTAAGGYDGQTLTHGDWEISRYLGNDESAKYAIQSQYNYRNIPIMGEGTHNLRYNTDATFTIAYTRPAVTTEYGAPMFKTQRRLQSRAIVSDSFNKMSEQFAYVNWQNRDHIPGFADQAHQEGYNILYGDYSTKWYGDPTQRIIYWRTAEGGEFHVDDMEFTDPDSGVTYNVGPGSLYVDGNARYSYIKGPYDVPVRFAGASTVGTEDEWVRANHLSYNKGPAYVYAGSGQIWHTFDTAHGQDVGAVFSPPNADFPEYEKRTFNGDASSPNTSNLYSAHRFWPD
jgi:hypothetical protein